MKAKHLSLAEIISNIKKEKRFEAQLLGGGFKIKINKYVPFCCTAIHNGSLLRNELKQKIALNEFERWYEEDPFTADFITSMPITIEGLDSRFEYDLNRAQDQCIYEEAWGKKVWKKKLSLKDIKISKQKHAAYYQTLHTLISKLEEKFGACVVYDIHSYNYKRWERETPLFNIGTEKIDKKKFGKYTQNWLDELSKIVIPQVDNTSRDNDVFFGRGYNLEFINSHFQNTLVLATEIKKIYCDELNGDIYPKRIKLLQQQLKIAVLNNAHFFSKQLNNWQPGTPPKLLEATLNKDIQKVDQTLYQILCNFELLVAVNPVNTQKEKNKFLRSKYHKIPDFRYRPVKINPYEVKQKLYNIPVQDIQDISIKNLYEAVISSFSDKISMISTLNTKKFLYNSLRYFGRPSATDLINAEYLVHLPEIPTEALQEPVYHAEEARRIFMDSLDEYQINAKVELSNKVIARILVLNSRKTILIQSGAVFKRKELNALIEHEIGVHMTTTINSAQQNLKVFNLGLPVNTRTQEGLAILAEYLSGNITLQRLKKIALRVIIVDMMSNGADFIDCFDALYNDYHVEDKDAFDMVTRIFRGGGFTKDYLYLNGFASIYKLWQSQNDISHLFIGKTSLNFSETIEEMIARKMIVPPQFIAKSFQNPQIQENSPIYDYILSGLK